MNESNQFNFAEFLGISEERSEEIVEFFNKNHKRNDTMKGEMTALLEEFGCSDKELFYVAFQLGARYNRMEQRHSQIEGLKKLLGCCGD